MNKIKKTLVFASTQIPIMKNTESLIKADVTGILLMILFKLLLFNDIIIIIIIIILILILFLLLLNLLLRLDFFNENLNRKLYSQMPRVSIKYTSEEVV